MTNPGWECPKCGSVYAPTVQRCWACPQGTTTNKPDVISQKGATTCGCPLNTAGQPMHHIGCPLHHSNRWGTIS